MSLIITKQRIQAIDTLRGLVMVIMALDHTREYFSDVVFSPTDLDQTSVALFFTRWITHFCATVFIFLVGTSMSLALSAGKTKQELSFFLMTRGIWLILADLTLIHLAWTFAFDFSVILFDVLTVTGVGMMALSLVIFLPNKYIFWFGAILVVGHHWLDGHESALLGSWQWLHLPDPFIISLFDTSIQIIPLFSVLPWIGIPALGYVFGSVYSLVPQARAKWLLILGLSCICAFVLLRLMNVYGDLQPWTFQKESIYTFLAFLNVNKYPPSLLYLLMTLGPAILLLIPLERWNNKLTYVLSIFGKVPFFYYVVHIFLIHFLAVCATYFRFGQPAKAYFGNGFFILTDRSLLAPYGYSLPVVYLVWLTVLVVLFPLCQWYAEFKLRHRGNLLLSYL